MKVSHSPATLFAAFDDPDLIAHAGLVPTLRLAERCGLPRLVAEKVRLTGAANGAGTAADAKALSIVGGMIAGADSIEDLDVLRYGGLSRLFGGVRAPSTLGSFLRAFTRGHVRPLESAVRAFTCTLATHTGLVPKRDEVVFVDIDSKVKQVYGPAKQGASFGHTKQRGLHFQIVTVKTSTCAPVIVATRLRKGSAGSGKGAASLLREALATVRAMGITAQIIVRADSAYFSHKVVDVCRKAGARFSLAVVVKKKIREAIAHIAEDAWTPVKYTAAVWDSAEARWVSDAEIAEVPFTAFTSKKKAFHTAARLIVRRVKRLNPKSVPEGQAELFGVWRHHVIFTDSPFVLAQAEPMHREHAVVEQVFADLEDSALAHLPSGRFTANSPRGGAPSLAHPRGHRLQPHPGRRPPRLRLPRQGADRHHPPPPDPRPRPDRHRRPPPHPPPARTLVLGRRLHRPVDDDRTAHGHLNRATALPAPDPKDLGDPAPDGHPAIAAARVPKKHPEPARRP